MLLPHSQARTFPSVPTVLLAQHYDQLQMEAHPALLIPQPSTPECKKKNKIARTPSVLTDLDQIIRPQSGNTCLLSFSISGKNYQKYGMFIVSITSETSSKRPFSVPFQTKLGDSEFTS